VLAGQQAPKKATTPQLDPKVAAKKATTSAGSSGSDGDGSATTVKEAVVTSATLAKKATEVTTAKEATMAASAKMTTEAATAPEAAVSDMAIEAVTTQKATAAAAANKAAEAATAPDGSGGGSPNTAQAKAGKAFDSTPTQKVRAKRAASSRLQPSSKAVPRLLKLQGKGFQLDVGPEGGG
jgi:hypothetical protein